MSDPEFQRLAAAVKCAEQAYGAAIDELAKYLETRQATIAKVAVADPATLGRVRQMVDEAIRTVLDGEWTSHTLAEYLAGADPWPGLHAKTLENVYLPALRETCPHAVQSGKTWLWYKDAVKSREVEPQVPRDTVASARWTPNAGDRWPGKLTFDRE